MSIEVKYEVRASDGNPFWFFVLDDATQGILQESAVAGSYDYVLGGSLLVDITDRVKSINITRGKNRAIDVFDPSLANVVFDNSDRTFDPLYAESDFFGAIKPNRTIAVVDNEQTIYLGIVQDWNISYDISGESIAAAAAGDAMSLFALQNVSEGTATAELSSTRVTKILEESGVSYPYYPPTADPTQSDKNIYTGSQTLGADVVEGGTTVLDYLQLIELSEPGKFFIDKFGRPTFVGRNSKG
jgi:hypothetical protein